MKQQHEIPFIDLQSQRKRLGSRLDQAIQRVLEHGVYIMGPEVLELEKRLSDFCGAKHVLSCSNGTDALALILMAKGIGPGDAVFVPSFTFAASAEVLAWVGATPVFVGVEPENTYNMDPACLRQGIKTARKLGLIPKVVMTVDVFGQPADYDSIEAICEEEGMWLLSDAAQSFGAVYKGRKVGTIGLATSTSFFPAKPLGCYGDGGAVFTDDDELIEIMRSLRVHGQAANNKYENVRIGMNGRLDTLQAAILLEKLNIFEDEVVARNKVAARYNAKLKDIVQIPIVRPSVTSVWAQYAFLLPENVDRAKVMKQLKEMGVPSVIYYPKPLHQQTAYRDYPTATGGALPITESTTKRVLSLPMHPYLEESQQQYIIDTLSKILESETVNA